MNANNQAQFVDPVQVLPKENLLQIFSYLSQDEIDHSTKVCHHWRSSIQSDFILFTSVEIKNEDEFFTAGSNPDPWWDEEKAKLEGMRMTIGKLSRLASLSTNRLDQVSIGLSAFGGSMPRSIGSWRFSRLSAVFDILTLSSGYLTRIQLNFPKTIPNPDPIQACRDYVTTILIKLTAFPHLKEVELEALPLFKVVSKSKRKKLTLSSRSHGQEHHYSCQYCQNTNSTEFPFDVLDISSELYLGEVMNEMNAFTGGRITHLGSNVESDWEDSTPYLSSEVMAQLLGYEELLEQLEVQPADTMHEVSDLVMKCRNLTGLKLYIPEDWELELPLEAVESSILKQLSLKADGPQGVVLNECMLKWIGNQLEHLCWKRECRSRGLIATLEVSPLFNLVQSVSFTLKSLEIVGFYHSNLSLQPLSGSTILSALKEVKLLGNTELINAFCSVFQCPSLTSLHLCHQYHLKRGEGEIDMKHVYNLLDSSANSLESLACPKGAFEGLKWKETSQHC